MENQVQLQRRIGFEDSFLFPVTDNVGKNGFRNFERETERFGKKILAREGVLIFSGKVFVGTPTILQ
ncbi:hypothetical protein DLM78_23470 [Leptospira stimsonii]|uniref:Uncharacterized protein n=1 Tax=Leptospira stimsonii TaxID=2202203 RepID=A0A8B3CGU0_9LEPT|nr:hypothetical protein DLM78_23470 [Leptospira stimsonii]